MFTSGREEKRSGLVIDLPSCPGQEIAKEPFYTVLQWSCHLLTIRIRGFHFECLVEWHECRMTRIQTRRLPRLTLPLMLNVKQGSCECLSIFVWPNKGLEPRLCDCEVDTNNYTNKPEATRWLSNDKSVIIAEFKNFRFDPLRHHVASADDVLLHTKYR